MAGHPKSEQEHNLRDGTISRVAQQKHDSERVSVFIDDEFAFGLTLDLAIAAGLKKGKPLTVEEQQTLLEKERPHRAYAVALHFVGYQPRTSSEVRRKLRRKGYDENLIEDTIERLEQNHFLDDESFAASFVRSRFNGSGYGPSRLRADLIKKGVASQIIDRALAEFQDEADLKSKAQDLAERRWKKLEREMDPFKRKKKLLDYLVRRGYDYGLARKVVEEMSAES
ncbi:MAG: RecX family transcriptional regulator [Rubricoccaceae bacterium]|nr:RecX family transcriptional regulator [Rubricoccaceae bacterium]